MSGSMITEKANYFYDDIKVTGNCIFSEGCNKTCMQELRSLKVLSAYLEYLTMQHLGVRCA